MTQTADRLPETPPNPISQDHSGEHEKPRVLNLAEAAKFVRCSKAHLCNIVNGKVRDIPQLPAVRVGRRVLFRRESLERWLIEVESSCSRRAIS
ncbi:MAG: helix-turn-helix domain-containing protein [Bryobacteraceae bacterium]|nr:helix-turn-helix domain-containing protein [Bryobacteraceae bacterium]